VLGSRGKTQQNEEGRLGQWLGSCCITHVISLPI
jgi:hypothetical protein